MKQKEALITLEEFLVCMLGEINFDLFFDLSFSFWTLHFIQKKNKKNQTSKKIKNISCPNDFVAPSSASCSSSFFFFPMFAALDRFLFPSRESSGSYLQWYTYVLTVCLLSELCWNISNSQCTYTFIRSGQKGSHVRARRI